MAEEGYTKATLAMVATRDVDEVWKKDQSYGRSWMKRGGVGAFMMLARKWDRLEQFAKTCDMVWNIFRMIRSSEGSGADGAPLAEVRDLRRYLLLVEAHMVAEGVVKDYILSAGPNEPKPFQVMCSVTGLVCDVGCGLLDKCKRLIDLPMSTYGLTDTVRTSDPGPRGFDSKLDFVHCTICPHPNTCSQNGSCGYDLPSKHASGQEQRPGS